MWPSSDEPVSAVGESAVGAQKSAPNSWLERKLAVHSASSVGLQCPRTSLPHCCTSVGHATRAAEITQTPPAPLLTVHDSKLFDLR